MGKILKGLTIVARRPRTSIKNAGHETVDHTRSGEPTKSLQKPPDKNLLRTFRRHGHKFK